MAHPRRLRFGIQLADAPSGDEWAALARRVEGLGFDSLLLPDHFGAQLAPVPAMAAAAAATTELKVGTLVHDNDYKHPVVLAKELATIDRLSGGRLEVGLGAGWMLTDYQQAGIPYDPGPVRVDRFEEGLTVLKGLLGPDPVTFSGDHYEIDGLDGYPKPHDGVPPIIVGGGMKRMLTIAGREADIVGINPTMPNGAADADAARTGTATETDRKLGWVKEAAGDRYDDLEINLLNLSCIVTDDRDQVAAELAPLFGLTAGELLEFPHVYLGTVDQICDAIQARRERWDASYLVVQTDALDAMAPVVARLRGT
ncbi:MAG: TIGR03621 family F420-dependent LLM class oxidoreductase [Acidimicrobiales bacterium]|nr:TIGR03621 family F420-dependent LLM class oxidoreductase [Acidimicrobiales bacterium]